MSTAQTARGAGFTVPACSVPIQKLILRLCDWKSPASHLHWGWGDEGGRAGGERKGGGEVAVEEWHHLPWNVTIISSLGLAVYRGDIILSLPLPPSVLVCGEGGCLFVCVCTQACLRECSEALWRGAWVDVCLRSPRSTSYSSDASLLLASISANAITINVFVRFMQNKQTKNITDTDSLFLAKRKNCSDAWS